MSETGRFTTMDGCTIHYALDGPASGTPLILCNSLGASMAMWDAQVPAFAQAFRVVRYDTRGHGLSGVRSGDYGIDRLGCDVVDLMDCLGIERADICGISLGGMTALWLGCRAPQRIRRLVVAHSSARLGPAADWQQRIETVHRDGVGAIARAVVERWVTPDFLASHRDQVADLVRMVAWTKAEGYAGCCAAIRDMDLRPMLGRIEARTLVIAGRDDPATPPEHSRLIADALRDGIFRQLPGAHLSNIEFPDTFNVQVLQFLTEGG